MIQPQISIEEQKKIADELIEKLSSIDSDVLLAGGAPRDWYLGNIAQDLDIYLYGIELDSKLDSLGLYLSCREFGCYYEDSNPYLVEIYSGEYRGVRVQIMNMNHKIDPNFVLNTFLLDICKAWYKNGIIQTHKDFDDSISHKIIRKVGLFDNQTYVNKIVSRFPEFLFVG